ncbi:hypothetical protein ANN_27358 [Periplaneta americana]|uniref:Uncharacterized protein n=1 Tax=Periplaneta americana TaxID=6978 RepID=A0ABQ8RY20_PERAM|nr:hypothetical protein ANN_27358 [Periplaneta americana]
MRSTSIIQSWMGNSCSRNVKNLDAKKKKDAPSRIAYELARENFLIEDLQYKLELGNTILFQKSIPTIQSHITRAVQTEHMTDRMAS